MFPPCACTASDGVVVKGRSSDGATVEAGVSALIVASSTSPLAVRIQTFPWPPRKIVAGPEAARNSARAPDPLVRTVSVPALDEPLATVHFDSVDPLNSGGAANALTASNN